MFEVDLPGSRVVFTTRSGGHSEGPFSSLNLGRNTPDEQSHVALNLKRLAELLELDHFQHSDQVHGAQLNSVGRADAERIPVGDGLTTTERAHPLLITGADCPTVVIASGQRLTALHCGWRPVADGLIERALEDFAGEEFKAVIGPGICAEHFEVGPEVIAAIGADAAEHSEGRQLDLTAVIRTKLERGGAADVHQVEHCTSCEPELFFSHRRDGELTGRQAGVAWRI